MEMYNNLKNRPYQINENGIDEFGVDHSKFSIREALEYNKKMLQENQSILPSSDNTFNSNPTNVYNNGIQYAQNNLNNTANDGNIENNQIDYSLYGNGFSKEFIDEINNDARFQQIMNNKVFPNEGGYVNNPNDPGKETNFGISSL